jgi:hypothetical protein
MSHPFTRSGSDEIEYSGIEGPPLTDDLVRDAEAILGVRLPPSYVALMRRCNGGYLTNGAFPMSQPTRWADDHISVTSIAGIAVAAGDERDDDADAGNGILSTPYMQREWGLPDDIVLLDGEGHWWVALDYRSCGPTGTPSVVWLALEDGEDIQVAPDFETFMQGLVPAEQFYDGYTSWCSEV